MWKQKDQKKISKEEFQYMKRKKLLSQQVIREEQEKERQLEK